MPFIKIPRYGYTFLIGNSKKKFYYKNFLCPFIGIIADFFLLIIRLKVLDIINKYLRRLSKLLAL